MTSTTQVRTGPGPVLLLVEADSDTERTLLTRWAADNGLADARTFPLHGATLGPALQEVLTAGSPDDTIVAAAQVAWLPRERNGVRRARWADALTFRDPRRPPPREQERILSREPDRAQVVVAEPATVAELRDRCASSGTVDGFARFVSGQAHLALRRAVRALVGDRYKVPTRIVETIESDPAFRREVTALAERLELPEREVTARIGRDLRGLVASLSPMATDLLAGALRPLHSRAWDVVVDESGVQRLRELNKSGALVFLPSHRSYADPLLLADVLAERDFPRNHVLGGENLRFWPVGPVARRAGVVFIRRVFGDDEVYKFAVREYFVFLLSKRFNLEWYMEGGRSRTGKLRPPRYGLLANVADALERGRVPDVHLVPVSITYDQLREVAAMAAEQAGAAKKGEGIAWLARYATAQLRQIGVAHVRFAEPISLRAALDGHADRRTALRQAAFDVAAGINRVTPVTATALVALALLGVRDRALTLGQVQRVLAPVRDHLDERALPHSGDVLRTASGVRGVLAALTAERVVTTYSGGTEPVYAIEPGQHLVAAFYRNSAVHHFVDRALAELLVLVPEADREVELAELRELLGVEFFLPDVGVHTDRVDAELSRLAPEGGSGAQLLRAAPFLVAHRVLRSFVDAQLVVAERLAARNPRVPVVEKDFLDECSGVGKQMLLQGRLHGPESLSRELFAGALRLAGRLDLVDAGRDELARSREEFAQRVRQLVQRVIAVDVVDAETLREIVDEQR